MRVALIAADEMTRARVASVLAAAGHVVIGAGDPAAEVAVIDGVAGAEVATRAEGLERGQGIRLVAGLADGAAGAGAALRGGADMVYPAGDVDALLLLLATMEAQGWDGERVDALVERATDAMYRIGFDGRVMWANASAERLTGYPRARLVGMHYAELLRDPRDLSRAAMELRAKAEGRAEGSIFEVRLTTANGEEVAVEISNRLVVRNGRPWAVEGVARDLRPRQRLVEQLRREAELFAQLGVAAGAIDAEGRTLTWNRAAEALFGVSADEVAGQSVSWIFPAEGPASGRAILERVLAGETVSLEGRFRRADGSTFPGLLSAAPLRDEQGRAVGGVGVVLDLTVERERQERLERLAAVVASSEDAVTIYDAEGRITEWNAAAERIYGRKAEEVLGLYAWELAPEDERSERRRLVERVLGGESVSELVVRRDGPSGIVGWLSLSAFPLRDATGRVVGAAAVARDVTALVEAQRELSWLAAIVGSAEDAVIGRDNEGRIRSWNGAAERMFGYSAEEMIGTFGEATVPAERLDAYWGRLREVTGDGRVAAEVMRQDREGRVFPARATTFPVYDREGRRLGSATFLRDISDERAVREALDERERLLGAVFESAGESMVIVGRDGRIRWLNQFAAELGERVFGKRPGPGDDIRGWVAPGDTEAWEAAFAAALGGDEVVLAGRLQRLDGVRMWFEVSFRPVRSAGREVDGVALVGRDVTDRVEAERAVRAREATLRSIFESTQDHLWLLDRDGYVLACNAAAAEFAERRFGQRPAPGSRMTDFADPEERALLEDTMARALAGETVAGEVSVGEPDGSKQYFNIQLNPVRDGEGRVTGIVVAARDVTEEASSRRELRRAREALAEEYAKLSTIIENSDEGIILLDRACRLVAFNAVFAEGTRARRGLEPKPGMAFVETVSPESAPFLLERVREGLAGQRVSFEVESQSPGERRWFEVRIRPVVTREGEVAGVVYTGRDVTERKRLEEERERALAEARRLASVVESSTEAVVAIDRDGRVAGWNRAAELLYGWSAEEALGQQFSIILPPEDVEAANRLFGRLLAGETYRGEMGRVTRDGRRLVVDSAYFPLRDGEGRVIGVGCVSHDVTREREMERRIAETAADLSATLAAIHEGVALLGADGVVLAANPALVVLVEDLFGSRLAPGMSWREVLPEELHEAFAEVTANTLAGEMSNFERQVVDREGAERWLELSFGRVVLDDGRVRGIALSVRDVTDRKRTEERLLQAQKAESLAVLAGGIAHDFNNLLVGILGNAGLALAELPLESPVRPMVEDIELAGRRAADLARQILAYSGKGKFVVQPLSLNGLVEEMTHLLRTSVGAGVHLVLDLDPEVPSVVGDATQLRQVLMNLVINASDAIGSREGTVLIRTSTAVGGTELFERAVVAPERLSERYVVLEVADTGAGMDEATLARIFDPFFTTKFTGRGLGLAAVLGIVRGHRGGIVVESEVGRGTRFRVLLPGAGDSRSESEKGGVAGVWRGNGAVIVADDEASVRSVTARALRAMGFEVLEAADGEEAVQRFAEARERVRLVLLDMTMPRMNGEAAFRAIRELDPKAKVVLMSGYAEQDAAEQVGEGLAGFVQKPYELGSLQELVRRVLEGSAR